MSNLAMTPAEEKSLDSKIELMMDWAKSHKAEAEQLAMDAARLLACSSERTDSIEKLGQQGFFKRCWNRFNGEAGAMERANINDLIQLQKMGFRYVNMLQEQQVLMAHSLLSLKNNLNSLAVKEEQTVQLIKELAKRTLKRLEDLEKRTDQLEQTLNIQGWALTLKARKYHSKYPTEYMRLFRVLNDFYTLKNDNWNYQDLLYISTAIDTVGLDPEQKISLNTLIDRLVDEIQSENVGFDSYTQAISEFIPEGIENFSQYALENISSPVFATLHGIKLYFKDRLEMVEEISEISDIPVSEALKKVLRKSIKNMNVDLDYEFPLAETAIELLGCIRLSEKLQEQGNAPVLHQKTQEIEAAPQTSTIEEEHEARPQAPQSSNELYGDTIHKAILRNDYAPGGNEAGLFIKGAKKLNPINIALVDPFMGVAPGETPLFHFSPRARKQDGDEIILTNSGLILKRERDYSPNYIQYDQISSVGQRGRNLYIVQNGDDYNGAQIEIASPEMFNYLNSLLRDVLKVVEESTDHAKELTSSGSGEAQASSELGKRDEALFTAIRNFDFYPKNSSKGIFVYGQSRNAHLKEKILSEFGRYIDENEEILFIYDARERKGYGNIIVITLDNLYGFKPDSSDEPVVAIFEDIKNLEQNYNSLIIETENYNHSITIPSNVDLMYISSLADTLMSKAMGYKIFYTPSNLRFCLLAISLSGRGEKFVYNDNTFFGEDDHCSAKLRKKIDNFIDKNSVPAEFENVIAYHDNTLFGDGDEGLLMTFETLYYSNSKNDKGAIDFENIKSAIQAFPGIIINTPQGKHEIKCNDDKVASAVANSLAAIAENKRLFFTE